MVGLRPGAREHQRELTHVLEVQGAATTTGPEGANIRICSAEVARASVTAMGFNATTMNRGDVPAAIQRGIGVNLGIGDVTPPPAPLLYLGARVANTQVNKMLWPTTLMILFARLPTLIVTTYVPAVSLWLPNLVLGR